MFRSRRLVLAVVLVAIVVLGSAIPALAVDSDPEWTLDLPAGLACNFGLRIDIYGDAHQIYKEFSDRNDLLVRSIGVGKGSTLTYTNVSTGASMWTRGNGAGNHTTYNADGSQTVMLTGHNIVIMFPTDIPAGPSTTLYVGSVAYTIDAGGNFTLHGSSGVKIDICAALSD